MKKRCFFTELSPYSCADWKKITVNKNRIHVENMITRNDNAEKNIYYHSQLHASLHQSLQLHSPFSHPSTPSPTASLTTPYPYSLPHTPSLLHTLTHSLTPPLFSTHSLTPSHPLSSPHTHSLLCWRSKGPYSALIRKLWLRLWYPAKRLVRITYEY